MPGIRTRKNDRCGIISATQKRYNLRKRSIKVQSKNKNKKRKTLKKTKIIHKQAKNITRAQQTRNSQRQIKKDNRRTVNMQIKIQVRQQKTRKSRLRPRASLKKVQPFYQLPIIPKNNKKYKKSTSKSRLESTTKKEKIDKVRASPQLKIIAPRSYLFDIRPKQRKQPKAHKPSKLGKNEEQQLTKEVCEDGKIITSNFVKTHKKAKNDRRSANTKNIAYLEQLYQKQRRLFLVELLREQKKWILKIFDSTSKTHLVRITPSEITCNCLDFRLNRHVCSDMHFVSDKILRNEALREHLRFKTEIEQDMFFKLEQKLIKIFQPSKDHSIYDDVTFRCGVCFGEETQGQKKDIQRCEQCSKCFHKECLQICKNLKIGCIFCNFRPEVRHSQVKKQAEPPILEIEKLQI